MDPSKTVSQMADDQEKEKKKSVKGQMTSERYRFSLLFHHARTTCMREMSYFKTVTDN